VGGKSSCLLSREETSEGGRFLGRSKAGGGSNRFYESDPHTLTALGGFLIPGWDIVVLLNLLLVQESGKETVLVVWAWKFINFRPPLDQKGETVS
jgi:hypothetical protein